LFIGRVEVHRARGCALYPWRSWAQAPCHCSGTG
jgi:hypothetical protein